MDSNQEEYNRLYRLLTTLSSKNQTLTEHGIVPLVSLHTISNEPLPPTASSIIPPPQSSIAPMVEQSIKIDRKRKGPHTCEACLKSFTIKSTFDLHIKTSEACIRWKQLPEEQRQIPAKKAIHELVDDWLEQAIGVPNQIKCQYCNMTFVSKGNHHKHYQVSTACNRLAYLEFKQIIGNLE